MRRSFEQLLFLCFASGVRDIRQLISKQTEEAQPVNSSPPLGLPTAPPPVRFGGPISAKLVIIRYLDG
jgi:hypothetical protein